jgi:hypothetical protein
MTQPINIEGIEDVISAWVQAANPGIAVHFPERQDAGAPIPAPPSAFILQLSPDTAIGQDEIRPVPSIMKQRVTVTAGGPNTAGIDFRLGRTEQPTRIEVDLLGGDDADAGAVKLLAEFIAELPAGVTASADPEDPASIIVDGSEPEPLFSCAPAGVVAVTSLVERTPKIHARWSRMTYRVEFRSLETRGYGTAPQLMSRAQAYTRRTLIPALKRVGWQYKGVLLETTQLPADRRPGLATLDFALEGYATIAFQDPALRYASTHFAPN